MHNRLVHAAVWLMLLSANARAQLTAVTSYDYDVLTPADRQTIGRDLVPQMIRGSMALVFPDGRQPITDPRAIREWVVSGKPLRAVAFPGLNADAFATWALAKEVAITNARHDLSATFGASRIKDPQKYFARVRNKAGKDARVEAALKPVLAVNTGWADWGVAVGHFWELAGVRLAVDAGRYCPEVSTVVARMVQKRFARQRASGAKVDPVTFFGYSAGGYHAANAAWLFHHRSPADLGKIRVQNVGLAARLPASLRAVQTLGTTDFVGKVNSKSEALLQHGTQVTESVSHLHGTHWRVGDAVSRQPLKIDPTVAALETVAPTLRLIDDPGLRRSLRDPSRRSDYYRAAAIQLRSSARTTREALAQHSATAAADKVIEAKLRHDSVMLGLQASRLDAAADLLDARVKRDDKAIAKTVKRIARIKRRKGRVVRHLQKTVGKIGRTMVGDSADFMLNVSQQTLSNMMPNGILRSWLAAADSGLRLWSAAAGWASPFVGSSGNAKRNSPLGRQRRGLARSGRR